MGIVELVLIGVGLAMDAFAVSVCKGLSMKKINWKKAAIIALYFGAFQALMPLLGYLLGTGFSEIIKKFDYLIAFGLLVFIGLNMIKESFSNEEEEGCEKCENDDIKFKSIIGLAVATSIDALAVGVTFAFMNINIIEAIIIIGVITFLISILGVILGNIFGDKFKNKAELLGGAILILIGLKILLAHFGLFNF